MECKHSTPYFIECTHSISLFVECVHYTTSSTIILIFAVQNIAVPAVPVPNTQFGFIQSMKGNGDSVTEGFWPRDQM